MGGILDDRGIQSGLDSKYGTGFGYSLASAVHEVANLPATVASKVASGIKSIFHGW